MGLFGGIGKALGGIVDVAKDIVGGVGDIANIGKSILGSPLGALLKTVFPPLALADGVLNFAGLLGDVSKGIGGGQNY